MALYFNAPPNWPEKPKGWRPEPGWQPDPAWGPAPEGWKFWLPLEELNTVPTSTVPPNSSSEFTHKLDLPDEEEPFSSQSTHSSADTWEETDSDTSYDEEGYTPATATTAAVAPALRKKRKKDSKDNFWSLTNLPFALTTVVLTLGGGGILLQSVGDTAPSTETDSGVTDSRSDNSSSDQNLRLSDSHKDRFETNKKNHHPGSSSESRFTLLEATRFPAPSEADNSSSKTNHSEESAQNNNSNTSASSPKKTNTPAQPTRPSDSVAPSPSENRPTHSTEPTAPNTPAHTGSPITQGPSSSAQVSPPAATASSSEPSVTKDAIPPATPDVTTPEAIPPTVTSPPATTPPADQTEDPEATPSGPGVEQTTPSPGSPSPESSPQSQNLLYSQVFPA